MRRRAGAAMVDEEFGDDDANASHECQLLPGAQQQEEQCCRRPDASAVTPSQAVPVVGVPNFPNCVKWSEENLLAIGAGHLVTILDPASMSGPRGFIPVAASPVFDFGSVRPADLQAHSLFQLCLTRDPRPGVRSIDWSPPGLAQNGGSFLAVCTTDSRVKLYRAPFCDFQSEWVEIIDLSEMVFNYCLNNDFREAKLAAARLAAEEETVIPPLKWGFKLKRKLSDDEEPRHRKVQKTKHHVTDKLVGGINISVARAPPASMSCGVDVGQHAAQDPFVLDHTGGLSNDAESPSIEKGSRVEVLEEDDDVQYWVSGSVVEIVDGEALVKLDRSQYGAMEEWVPLHGQKAVSDDSDIEEDQLSSGHQDGKKVIEFQRPRIRPEVAICTLQKNITDETGGERTLVSGELVEALINQRWQEGMVVELQGSGVVVDFSASSVNATVELNNLRLAPFWHGERWIWKTGSAVSKQRISPSHLCSNDTTFATTVVRIGQEVPNNSSEKDVGPRHGEIESMGGTIKSGHFTTSNALHMEQDNPTSPALSGSEQDSPHDITQVPREKSYSRVYKRRGLVNAAGIVVDSFDTEICTPRPIRSRRLPSKLRSENAVSWMTEPDALLLLDYDAGHENLSQDKDGDYVQKMRGAKDVTKAKHARFVKHTDNVKQVKSIKDNVILKEAKRSKIGDKEKPENKESGTKHNWISAHDFAARSEVLTPLALAWSSKYQDQFIDDGCEGKTGQCFVLLGAGMKSGRVSLWRMAFPPSYSIDHAHIPVTANFLGFLFAHDSWVNSLSWASCSNFDLGKLNAHDFPDGGSSSGDTLLLATGCADGSVKLWAALSRELAGSASVNNSVPFMYLTEVVSADSVPVTALALFVPSRPGDRALLAVGKGSGSVGVWELKSSGVFRQICLQLLAHQQMVTGFSWTSDGRCLYSCGQDSLKRWDFSQDQLLPLSFPDGSAVFPSNTGSDICSLETLESYFGVTLSPNGLALAAVRGIATDLLDQMYQARSQKGMVQLFWLGNEHIDIKKVNHSTLANISHSAKAMSGHDKACWELNIIEALEDLQDPRRTLVLWDVVATLSSLKEKLGAEGVVDILSKWLSSWTSGQGALGAVQSYDWSTGSFQKAIPEASCRRLQILNVIYRRVFLSHVKTEGLRAHTSEERDKQHDVELKLWKNRMHLVEHDLRQRLVHINLQIATSDANHLQDSAQSDNSLEIQLLVEWVLTNAPLVVPQLVTVATQLRSTKENSVVDLDASSPMEACTFCDSTVPFESPEIATCFGPDSKHRLRRCSVSMQVCPPVCLWHCGCCGRSAINQASSLFFSLSSREKITELSYPDLHDGDTFPSCPFCGILMHRLLPNFFLTPSLV